MIFEKQIVKAFKGMMHTRCDDTRTVFYFSASDFPGLKAYAHSFISSAGNKLKGYFYCYENPTPGRIVVFDHGFGGGHRAYMKEIEMLCSHGFLVYSYDHTGCMESEGESPNGLAQSLSDLCDCIGALKALPELSGYDISVMGHSWGAFSSMNVAAYHPDISHVVAISGFISVESMVGSFFRGIMKPYRRAIMRLERESNTELADVSAVKTLSACSAKVLLIYSDNDTLCRKNPHYDTLYAALSGKENIKFILTHEKGHNPNYTSDAVIYLAEFFKKRARLAKKKLLGDPEVCALLVGEYDWRRMTEQDPEVWAEIFRTLDS